MKKVADILAHKGRSIISVTPEAIVIEALKIMSDKNIGSVLVMDGPAYVGLLTERDYARKVILMGRSSSETPVSQIMSTPVIAVARWRNGPAFPRTTAERIVFVPLRRRSASSPSASNPKQPFVGAHGVS